jgi:hypothetical protein
MRFLLLLGLALSFFACARPQERPSAPTEVAEVTFHVLGLQKTPSGAT